jgi:hypothetical protein
MNWSGSVELSLQVLFPHQPYEVNTFKINFKRMKIAVPVTKENQVDGHFGHCESYGVPVKQIKER